MFRNLAYITSDYTVRVQDGYLIFRWWRTYVPKDEDQDLSHSDTRVSLQLYGFEFHVYNRSKVYRDLEKKLFGESHMFGDESASMLTNDPFSFFGLLLLGKTTYQKKLDVKPSPFSSSNRGKQRCNDRKSRLSKLLSFVPNQRLPYKLVDR